MMHSNISNATEPNGADENKILTGISSMTEITGGHG